MTQELSPAELRRAVDPAELGFDNTRCLEPLHSIIGQQRAVDALRFGLGIEQIGFNIYVSGPHGMGKMSAVKNFLDQMAQHRPAPPDWCYVNNFDDAYQPKALRLPPGRGRQLQQDMQGLVDQVRRGMPKAFESEEYSARRDAIIKRLERERESLFQQLNEQATQAGLAIQASQAGIAIVPVLGGRPLTENEFQALPAAAREDFQKRREAIQDQLKATMKQGRAMERRAQEELIALDRDAALNIVGELIDDVAEKHRDTPGVADYLEAVKQDIVKNLDLFRPQAAEESGEAAAAPWQRELPFRKYQVNVVVDNGKRQGAPVVVVLNPTYNNLAGRIEKETQYGALYTDFTMIKAGALHQANGGYLVLGIEDVLGSPYSWEALKRALRAREIAIEEMGELAGYITTKSLHPEPIPLDAKVILIGPPRLYYLLHEYDDEFPEQFRVKADFDTRMPRTDENVRDFLAFVCTFCNKESLRHLDGTAAARLLEHASRLAGDQDKLTTHFGAVADVIRESHFWAEQAQSPHITVAHVRKAIEEKMRRSDLVQRRVQELMVKGTILIDTDGADAGQVNGLSVIRLGDYEFGQPSRITCSVGPGHEGIVDIERQVALGGPIHTKGVMILQGYLTQKYLRDRALALSARLVFEQNYDGVEGDSASSTELYALLSALSRYPIRQGIAVTGSVNQHGEVQAIGGVNEKIEGFFDVCHTKGLTGDQGVIIPASNARDLMLREDVVDAARDGRFHVWAVKTIDEGIEILTGVPAGQRRENGKFPEGTVNARVELRLRELADAR
jgi:lon-related putative ATP-dependent protease